MTKRAPLESAAQIAMSDLKLPHESLRPRSVRLAQAIILRELKAIRARQLSSSDPLPSALAQYPILVLKAILQAEHLGAPPVALASSPDDLRAQLREVREARERSKLG